GGRGAERGVTVAGSEGGAVDAASLWVHVDTISGRPAPLSPHFFEVYGTAAAGRVVTARLHHPDPPARSTFRPWPVRAVDFDVMGDMNNAAYWCPGEEELARRRDLRAPLRAEVEYRTAIDPDDVVEMVVQDGEGDLRLWLQRDGTVLASAFVWSVG